LIHLVRQWWHDPNFSHGFFVPAFSGFVVWQGRSHLAQIPLKPSWTGAGIVALALAVLVVRQTGAELFLARFSLLLLMCGLIVLFLGWNYLRVLLFPITFVVLMIPIPTIVFNQITFPLQLLASRLSAEGLSWLGVPVLRRGNVLILPAMALEIAEACSGIRSLMSLVTLAIICGLSWKPCRNALCSSGAGTSPSNSLTSPRGRSGSHDSASWLSALGRI
jgi:exosortase